MEMLLLPIGLACMVAAVAHGYLGQTRLIDPATFLHKQARGFVSMIWQYSTVTWAIAGLLIAMAPWIWTASQRTLAIPLLTLPILYGVLGNMIVSRGRHFGWKLFGVIITLANMAVLF